MRQAVVGLIQRIDDKSKVAEIDRLEGVARAVQSHGPPLLICTELLPQPGAVAGVVELRSRFPEVPILVFTSAGPQQFEAPTVAAGANAFIHKSASAARVSEVLRGFLVSTGASLPEKLSRRQKQLLGLLDRGLSNRDIAAALDITEHTVKVHLWRLFRRLNVKSRSQASHLARVRGLV